MYVEHLSLVDFRSYAQAELTPSPTGTTVVVGRNGSGKTNLIEAIGYLATSKSLRGSPSEALIKIGATTAVVRGQIVCPERSRRVGIDAQLRIGARDLVKVAGQPLRRISDLSEVVVVTVFSPADLDLVQGGPAGRRAYIDDLAVSLVGRRAAMYAELERVLKQRNSLLRSVQMSGWKPGRTLPADVVSTLDVWDHKLVEVGELIVKTRRDIVAKLGPILEVTYRQLAERDRTGYRSSVALTYRPSWEAPLADAVSRARSDDLRRGVTGCGPQRDDLELTISGMPSRTHASQGEQRTAALALRLAGHRLLTESRGTAPLLLLDDVFSELDAARSQSLMENLPAGQTILTTAGQLPEGITPAAVVKVSNGRLEQ
ncbi:MAG: DNA replication/repair protein RecF [Acidimicrobiales bacterium]